MSLTWAHSTDWKAHLLKYKTRPAICLSFSVWMSVQKYPLQRSFHSFPPNICMRTVYSYLLLHEQCPPTQSLSLIFLRKMCFYGLVMSFLILSSAELRRLNCPNVFSHKKHSLFQPSHPFWMKRTHTQSFQEALSVALTFPSLYWHLLRSNKPVSHVSCWGTTDTL